jgi:7-cyano-7-deazaguanine synthase
MPQVYGLTQQAVILLSGGLDSTVCLAWALKEKPNSVAMALTFDYGQRANKKELAATRAIAAYYDIPHRVIALDWLHDLLPDGMSQQGERHWAGALPVSQVWVPNRNGVLLNIAAAWAEALGVPRAIFGANLEEAHAGFPDNTTAFWERTNQALAYSTKNHVQVEAPLSELDKMQIVRLGLELKAPLHLIWSCYENGEHHCGQCASCQLLYRACSLNGWQGPEKLEAALV